MVIGSGVRFQSSACLVPPMMEVPECGRGSMYSIVGSDGPKPEAGVAGDIVVIPLASPLTVTVCPRIGYMASSGTRFFAPRPVALTHESICDGGSSGEPSSLCGGLRM